MSAPLDGLVAIVTGGASGLGAAIARRLREDGAKVAVFDVNPDAATDVDLALAVDVTDDASVTSGVGRVVEAFGRLDIVVNNAGIGAQGDVTANSDEEWHRVFDINVVGVARVSRAAIPYLRESPAAAICNTSSIAATAGLPQRAVYSATKGAVLSLTLAMAAESGWAPPVRFSASTSRPRINSSALRPRRAQNSTWLAMERWDTSPERRASSTNSSESLTG